MSYKHTLGFAIVGLLLMGVGSWATLHSPVATTTSAWAGPPAKRNEPPASVLLLSARYMSVINLKLQKVWNVSSVPLMELHRRIAVVHLFINAKGHVIKFRISQSSGLKSFDRSLIAAVRKAHPFVAPHPKLRKLLKTKGLELSIRRRVFRKKLFPNRPHYRGTVVVPNWRPRVMDRGVIKKKGKKKKKK